MNKPLFSYPKPDALKLLHDIERKTRKIYETAEDARSHNNSSDMGTICKESLDILNMVEYLQRRLINTFGD